jgi:hypothetical protein
VHDAFEVDGTRAASPAPQPSNFHNERDEASISQTEKSMIAGFDGNASGTLKRMPKALAVENDEWVELLDVRGCSEVWYDWDGDVVMRYGN